MEEFRNLIHQLKTIEIIEIKPIEPIEPIKINLNNCILEHLKTNKIKCSKCERFSQYKTVNDNTFLCWNHSLK
jgi:hypothetical protein